MSDDARLRAARALEERGDVDGAVRTYLAIGQPEAAAAALIGARRFAEGARALLRAVGGPVEQVSATDTTRRALACRAAALFAQAGETQNAVELHLGLGDPQAAAAALERAGDPGAAGRLRAQWGVRSAAVSAEPAAGASRVRRLEEAGDLAGALDAYVYLKDYRNAGRVAYALGRPRDAARFFLDGGMPYEAGVCFGRSGETGMALETLVRVPRDHERYRAACVAAITVAAQLGTLEFSLDDFLSSFAASPPATEEEGEALYRLAGLYEAHDFAESAIDALRSLTSARGSYRDAEAKLARLEEKARGSARSFERVVREDAAFHGARPAGQAAGGLPALPSLDDDDPPVAPAAPRAAPPAAARSPETPDARSARTAGHCPVPPAAPPPIASSAAVPNAVSAYPSPLKRRTEPPSPVDAMQPGTVVSGRYVIEREIGRGGMAVVYSALDREIEERVALKFFFGGGDSPDLLRRFKQELQIARRLVHPNIVQVYDLGTYHGTKFISMELLEGADLHAVIRMGLSLNRTLVYMLHACAGLATAHEQGVVHRDLKPANLFVTKQGPLKLMDFGIAKLASSPGMTREGFFAGTPEYMAPEQIQKFGQVTHLADIYALGMVAYECVTHGALPFRHAEVIPVLMMQVTELPDPPSLRKPGLPPELDTIILRCLEKDPAHRYPSCRALAIDLDALRRRFTPASP